MDGKNKSLRDSQVLVYYETKTFYLTYRSALRIIKMMRNAIDDIICQLSVLIYPKMTHRELYSI